MQVSLVEAVDFFEKAKSDSECSGGKFHRICRTVDVGKDTVLRLATNFEKERDDKLARAARVRDDVIMRVDRSEEECARALELYEREVSGIGTEVPKILFFGGGGTCAVYKGTDSTV